MHSRVYRRYNRTKWRVYTWNVVVGDIDLEWQDRRHNESTQTIIIYALHSTVLQCLIGDVYRAVIADARKQKGM